MTHPPFWTYLLTFASAILATYIGQFLFEDSPILDNNIRAWYILSAGIVLFVHYLSMRFLFPLRQTSNRKEGS